MSEFEDAVIRLLTEIRDRLPQQKPYERYTDWKTAHDLIAVAFPTKSPIVSVTPGGAVFTFSDASAWNETPSDPM